ncbi:HNH endonuclease [Simiduia curdlanivorans]|uniref:HNH endonuclease n=1 Tax=Simiduia curdlanivorans TaxID=1492769 RepID=A0ABV8V8J8_9GAMM|nr:HNH endonuclease [Simiduia curdlanivorans]MDN3638805.1 HNH endonuclease [Simiduia curdlanivorans]
MAILQLGQLGLPSAWLSVESAATLITKGRVQWAAGPVTTLRGGLSQSGIQSVLDVPAIIATNERLRDAQFIPALSNRLLFKRDNNQCQYCSGFFQRASLTRDHIIPRGQGGRDRWSNVVAACRRCNAVKGCRTPEQAKMPLLAVPFTPNRYEFMYLAAHELQGEQLDYLSANWRSLRVWC